LRNCPFGITVENAHGVPKNPHQALCPAGHIFWTEATRKEQSGIIRFLSISRLDDWINLKKSSLLVGLLCQTLRIFQEPPTARLPWSAAAQNTAMAR
jgi:hypothetical protein